MPSRDAILISTNGATEISASGVSYRVTPFGTFVVPQDVASVFADKGFRVVADHEDLDRPATIADVALAARHLPRGKVRSTLLAILASPNSMNHLIQSIAFA